jgi:hypothetical protein
MIASSGESLYRDVACGNVKWRTRTWGEGGENWERRTRSLRRPGSGSKMIAPSGVPGHGV